jgi:TolA-binding protein
MNHLLSSRAFLLILIGFTLASVACSRKGPSYEETLKSIEQIEVIIQQADRDGLPETVKMGSGTLDSLYTVYLSVWPDSSYAPMFMFNQANIRAQYLQDYESCIALLDSLTLRYPESEYVERARFLKGYTLSNQMKDTTRARVAYEEFLRLHPNSDLVPSVEFEIRTMGMSPDQIELLFQEGN